VTNTEVLSQYMEPRPENPPTCWWQVSSSRWWVGLHAPNDAFRWASILDASPYIEKLGWMHLIEERLTKEQQRRYIDLLYANRFWSLAHATADQKIEALASVLSKEVEGRDEHHSY